MWFSPAGYAVHTNPLKCDTVILVDKEKFTCESGIHKRSYLAAQWNHESLHSYLYDEIS